MKYTLKLKNKNNRKKNRKITQKSGGRDGILTEIKSKLLGPTRSVEKKIYKFVIKADGKEEVKININDVSEAFDDTILAGIKREIGTNPNELLKLLKIIYDYFEYSNGKIYKRTSTHTKINNLANNAKYVYNIFRRNNPSDNIIHLLSDPTILTNPELSDISDQNKKRDAFLLFIATECEGLNNGVLHKYKGFVWDFDDTLLVNKMSRSYNPSMEKRIPPLSLNYRDTYSDEELIDCFFQPELFIILISFLIKNGKTVGIISFGSKQQIKSILDRLFRYFGFPSVFTEDNIYGSDSESSVSPEIMSQYKVNFLRDFAIKCNCQEKQILFFDDNIDNIIISTAYGFQGILLGGHSSKKSDLIPIPNYSDRYGFFIEILFIINLYIKLHVDFGKYSFLLFKNTVNIKDRAALEYPDKEKRIKAGNNLLKEKLRAKGWIINNEMEFRKEPSNKTPNNKKTQRKSKPKSNPKSNLNSSSSGRESMSFVPDLLRGKERKHSILTTRPSRTDQEALVRLQSMGTENNQENSPPPQPPQPPPLPDRRKKPGASAQMYNKSASFPNFNSQVMASARA